MSVEARNETAEAVDLATVSDFVGQVLASEGGGGEISVLLVGPGAIRRLNREHRSLDTVTDVLAFPIDDDPDELPGVPRMLGDVVVCLEQARTQAVELGHSSAEELATLLAHGTLHLLGYDHEAETDAGRMFTRQDELVDRLPAVAWGP